MDNTTIKRHIYKYFHSTGQFNELDDHLIDEFRLKIVIEGRDFVQVVVYPFQLEDFVLGFLVTRGIIKSPSDISAIDIADNVAYVERINSLKREWPDLNLLETTGSRNIDLKTPLQSSGKGKQPFQVSASVVRQGVKMLADMPVFKNTGGTHCAILFDQEGEPLVSAEDIGRHNSVDKVIGGGLRKAADFSQCWLAVSGRLPSDMVIKPILVGIPLIASVSAPTSSGVETAEHAGLTLIGFSREGRFNCYSHPEKIIQFNNT